MSVSENDENTADLTVKMFYNQNCGKFASECDSNNQISQNVRNLGSFGKKMGFFENNLNFGKIGKCSKCAIECVSNDIIF